MTSSNAVSLKQLTHQPYNYVICYPRPTLEQISIRIKELMKLHVKAIEFTGTKKVNNLDVLGKGYVGVVVIAYRNSKKVALKIRRVDADRASMHHEAEMLKQANKMKVGPELLGETENFLLMEFIEGNLLNAWVEKLTERSRELRVSRVLREILEQCWRLDEAGLDHGELSNASKHVIVNIFEKPVLVDFETASTNRKTANVTSICQYLFVGSQVAKILAKKLGKINQEELIAMLKKYKKQKTRKNFVNILKACKIA